MERVELEELLGKTGVEASGGSASYVPQHATLGGVEFLQEIPESTIMIDFNSLSLPQS